MSQSSLDALPGVTATPDAATRDYVFNHTMLRVRDPRAALDFYTRVLGFTLVRKLDFEQAKFSLYFLVLIADRSQIPGGDGPDGDGPDADAQRKQWLAQQRGVLELTHNWGTENQPDFRYHDGNGEPRGFGHICISAPDVRAICARLEALGVPFQKRLSDGSMREIAFARDPDGYWVELIQPGPLA